MIALDMGGYGAFVWSSFALMFGTVVISALQARVRHHRLLREIKTRIATMEVRK